jgi:hypothetical protein
MDVPPSFVCPACQAESWHPEDVRQGYCGACHDFTGDQHAAALARAQELLDTFDATDGPLTEEELEEGRRAWHGGLPS